MNIAIIGSGPAGCYLADHLLRLLPHASIDILEKLPVPFGLIRYGVAPDHQSTKNVARVFDRVLSRDRVNFFGNVEVGRDVKLNELLELYDAVVLATGAARDRQLEIPGEDLPGVIGSGAFVGWYNGHPHSHAPAVSDVRSAVVIGNGNVALDVARILAKGREELAGSDFRSAVLDWLHAQPIETVHIVGRRSAADAKFNDHELAELGTLQRARPCSRNAQMSQHDGAVAKVLRSFCGSSQRDTPVSNQLSFQSDADRLPRRRQRSARCNSARPANELVEIPAQLAVTCIGYESLPVLLRYSGKRHLHAMTTAKIADRLYVVGWAKRGPSGTIPTNRVEAQQVAQKIAQEIRDGQRPGTTALRALLKERGCRWVDYAGWRRIDAAELSQAGTERCRGKLCSTNEMLEAAHAGQLRPA